MTVLFFSGTKKVPVAASQAFRLYGTIIIEENREVTKLFDKENIERGLPPRSQEHTLD